MRCLASTLLVLPLRSCRFELVSGLEWVSRGCSSESVLELEWLVLAVDLVGNGEVNVGALARRSLRRCANNSSSMLKKGGLEHADGGEKAERTQ